MSNLWEFSQIKAEPGIVVPGETVPEVFWNAVARRGDQVWLRQKELGLWRSHSWNQAGAAVSEIAAGLLGLGFAEGECAAILSNTVVEWVLCDLAILSCAGVTNGIYPTDAASQVEYLCSDSRTVVLFVEDDEQLDKALEVRARLPLLRSRLLEVHGTWQRDEATGGQVRHLIAGYLKDLTPLLGRLADAGIPLGSQTVLLKGVNDDLGTMKALVQGLLRIRVRPYYLYQCDPITGSAHFRTPVQTGIDIIRGLRGHTTGYAVPTYVIDAPDGGGKIPVAPDYVTGRDGDDLLLTNYANGSYRYPDPQPDAAGCESA